MLIVPTWIVVFHQEFLNIFSWVCAHGTSQIWYNNNLMRIKNVINNGILKLDDIILMHSLPVLNFHYYIFFLRRLSYYCHYIRGFKNNNIFFSVLFLWFPLKGTYSTWRALILFLGMRCTWSAILQSSVNLIRVKLIKYLNLRQRN